MKVLYVETSSGGHHDYYAECVSKAADESVFVVPYEIKGITSRQIIINAKNVNRKKFAYYLKWLIELRKVIKSENPDVVHFLWGDAAYFVFGFGLKWAVCGKPSIITCHGLRRSILRDISRRNISRNVNAYVVHTNSNKNDLIQMGLKNVVKIQYPALMPLKKIERDEALQKLGIKIHDGDKVLLLLSGMRQDKGLDVLLNALKYLQGGGIHLLVTGKESFFKQEFLQRETESFKDRVTYINERLNDEKYNLCINASDIVIIPYKRIFDGASGPLTDGAVMGKMIIASSHKSIGEQVTTGHLGYTFKTGDSKDLARVIHEAVENYDSFRHDENYREYQRNLYEQVIRQ